MYVDHPEHEEAYACELQFSHGDDLVARPVTDAASGGSATNVRVWLPPSALGWSDWNSSRLAPATRGGAPAAVTVGARLADLPLFARVGAALPLLPPDSLSVLRDDALSWALIGGGVPAVAGGGVVYVDDGSTTRYEAGSFATQALNFSFTSAEGGATLSVVMAAAVSSGGFTPPLTPRALALELRGFARGMLPTTAAMGGQPMDCTAASEHSLARARGTVVCTARVRAGPAQRVEAHLEWLH
jgi:hypothetical protein